MTVVFIANTLSHVIVILLEGLGMHAPLDEGIQMILITSRSYPGFTELQFYR